MSSSTSSSDPRAAWRGFTTVFLAVATLVLAAILGVAYALDPYDTGRSTLFDAPGVRPQGPRTAAASRGRDTAFDAAIVGNSHIQLLSPERLNRATGLSFVQLSVPATGPKEQLVLVDWFLRHRPTSARALVLSADQTWCTGDPELPNSKPFPFWLYSESSVDYLRGLLRYDLLEEIPRRFEYVTGRRTERARPDGYWDYEDNYRAIGFEAGDGLLARLGAPVSNVGAANRTGRFPAADRLRELAAVLPPELALIVVFPPTYTAALPRPGTAWARSDQACKDAVRQAAGVHSRSAVVDWRVDRPENRIPANYFDQTHYRQPIAHAVEADVADALKYLATKR
jgi:hypothetical protein